MAKVIITWQEFQQRFRPEHWVYAVSIETLKWIDGHVHWDDDEIELTEGEWDQLRRLKRESN